MIGPMLDSGSPFAIAQAPGAEAKNALAIRRLRHAVLSCEIAPGSVVGEADLAERFRLGRASVRVALMQLAQAGFVAAQARQGWRVAPVTGQLIGDLLSARARLEPALATVRPSAREQERLLPLVAMNAALARDDGGAAVTTARRNDRQILDLLAARLGGFEARWLHEAWDHCERVASWLDQSGPRWRPADRARLVAALVQGDEAGAQAALAEALRGFRDHVTAALLRLPVQTVSGDAPRRRRRPGRAPGTLTTTTTRTGKVT